MKVAIIMLTIDQRDTTLQGRRGNIEALRGLMRGLLDVVRPALPAG